MSLLSASGLVYAAAGQSTQATQTVSEAAEESSAGQTILQNTTENSGASGEESSGISASEPSDSVSQSEAPSNSTSQVQALAAVSAQDAAEVLYQGTVSLNLDGKNTVSFVNTGGDYQNQVTKSVGSDAIVRTEVTGQTVYYGDSNGATGTNSSYTGSEIPLKDCLYTYTKQEDGTITLSHHLGNSTVYVSPSGGEKPFSTNPVSIRVTPGYREESFLLWNYAYLCLWTDNAFNKFTTNGTLDSKSTEIQTQSSLYFYRPASSAKGDSLTGSTEIPGYVRVTDLGSVQDGEQLLVVGLHDGTYYAMRPSTDTSSENAHVVRVTAQQFNSYASGLTTLTFTGKSVGTTQITVGDTVYAISVKDSSIRKQVTIALLEGTSTTYVDSSGTYGTGSVETGHATLYYAGETVSGGAKGILYNGSAYVGEEISLSDCLYQLTGDEASGYSLTAQAGGTTVYLNYYGRDGYVNQTAKGSPLTVTGAYGEFTFFTQNQYLAFSQYNVFAQTGTSGENTKFSLYRAAEEGEAGSSEIPGYVKLQDASELQSGASYLIVKYQSDTASSDYGSTFVLHPSTTTSGDTGRNAQVAKVKPSTTTLTVQGTAAGVDTYRLGSTLYTIRVYSKDLPDPVTEENSVFVSGTGQSSGKSMTKLTLSAGTSFSVTQNTGESVVWLSDHPEIASVDENGTITAKQAGEARIIAAVGEKVYVFPIQVLALNLTTTGTNTIFDIYIHQIEHSDVYYSIDVSDQLLQASPHEVLYLTEANSSARGLAFFAKAEDGYVLSKLAATNSAGIYQSIVADTPEETEFYTDGFGVTLRDRFNDASVKAMTAAAMEKGCTGVAGFSRGKNSVGVSSSMDFISRRLPTVEKSVYAAKTKNGMQKISANTRVEVGDTIYYKVIVTTYYYPYDEKTEVLTYQSAVLTDNLQNAYFVDSDPMTGTAASRSDQTSTGAGTALDLTEVINASKTLSEYSEEHKHVYYVAYDVTAADVGKKITNTVSLDTTCQSKFGTTAHAESIEAIAAVRVAPKDTYDLVIHKVDKDTMEPLSGVGFSLYRLAEDGDRDSVPIQTADGKKNGIFIASGYTTIDGENATLTFQNLEAYLVEDASEGTVYYLQETDARPGYLLLSNAIAIRVTKQETEDGTKAVAVVNGVAAEMDSDTQLTVTVANRSVGELPQTGFWFSGPFFMTLGVAVMLLALVLLLLRKRLCQWVKLPKWISKTTASKALLSFQNIIHKFLLKKGRSK